MIIVKLIGGLGNQMFQYAAARRLAIRHNTELKLDLSFLENRQEVTTHRVYELKHLNINATIATPHEVAEFTGEYKNRYQATLMRLRRIAGLAIFHPNVYVEPHFHFDPAVLDAPDNSYLDGYWQSENYFKDIGNIIQNEFTVITGQGERNRQLAEEIKATESVSIHVRRGDFVSDKATKEFHGVCSLNYYKSAIDRIRSQVRSPHFFVFSDDPEWVKENLELSNPATFMDHNGPDKGYEDLRLMGLCTHHIIANSSFSWWGAWLGTHPSKIVIAPMRWFNDVSINTTDLLPETWMRM